MARLTRSGDRDAILSNTAYYEEGPGYSVKAVFMTNEEVCFTAQFDYANLLSMLGQIKMQRAVERLDADEFADWIKLNKKILGG